MKRSIALLACLLMVFAFGLAGCKQSPANTPSPHQTASAQPQESAPASTASTSGSVVTPVGTLPIVSQPVTLKFFIPENSSIQDMSTNSFTVWYEKRTGVHIDWDIAADNFSDKLGLVLASGDYPDVFLCGITSIGGDNERKYGTEQGVLIPVNDLIDQWCPNLTKFMGEIDGFKEQIMNLDGKIYGFPSYNACFHCENSQRMWLNQGWLDKLKLKAPTTTEEFYNVLKAFKNDDPNGNGKQDEIPLTSNIDGWHSELDGFLMNPFIISFTQGYSDMKLRLSAADGVIDSIADKDGYREGLRYINKLYAEGLIDSNAVTQKSNELKALFADPANDIVGAVPTGTMILNVDVNKNNETYSRYHAIAPLKGPTGLQQSPTFTVAPVAAQVCISKVCKYPEVVARWVDGFFDFYSADAYLVPVSRQCGIEGTDWRWGKEGEVGLDGKAQAKIVFINNPNDPSQNRCWANGEGPYVWSAGMRLGLLSDPTKSLYDPDMVDPLLYDVSKNLMEPYATKDWKIVPPIKYTSDESTQLSTLTVDLKKYISENYAAFVSGQKSLDTDWDSYVSGLKSIGLDKYLQIVNTGYARQYGSK